MRNQASDRLLNCFLEKEFYENVQLDLKEYKGIKLLHLVDPDDTKGQDIIDLSFQILDVLKSFLLMGGDWDLTILSSEKCF